MGVSKVCHIYLFPVNYQIWGYLSKDKIKLTTLVQINLFHFMTEKLRPISRLLIDNGSDRHRKTLALYLSKIITDCLLQIIAQNIDDHHCTDVQTPSASSDRQFRSRQPGKIID